MGAVFQPEPPGARVDWGFIQLSLANVIVIALMLVVFALALVLPFPGGGGRRARQPERRPHSP